MSRSPKVIALLLIVITISTLGFVIWAETPLGPMPEALQALDSDDQVQTTTDPWLIFESTTEQATTGLIFYPGGRVDPRSYAPAMHKIAAQGYLVVIVPMPLNLAVFSPARAADVIEAFPKIEYWAIAGHSLGGAMAANYIDGHPEQIQGLALWASYPASGDDLSNLSIEAVSIYATLDGLATQDKIEASRRLLPEDTVWVQIEGGNHAQFGWYGEQPGDNPATISREEQQEQIINATLQLLDQISQAGP